MRALILILILTLSDTTFAKAPLCSLLFEARSKLTTETPINEPVNFRALHVKSADSERNRQITAFADRVDRYFARVSVSGHEADQHAAHRILADLARIGSPLDLKIFDTYLSILESTTHPNTVEELQHYLGAHVKDRPSSSHFQENHWDWAQLHDYLFESPSSLSFVKEEDLRYLQTVLQTAKNIHGPPYLRYVILRANQTWMLMRITQFQDIKDQLTRFEAGRSYELIHARFRTSKLYQWLQKEVPAYKRYSAESERRELAIRSFGDTSTTLDLMIFEKYFDLKRTLGSGWRFWQKPDLNVSVTDWDIFENGLERGDLLTAIDFLFQNAHDIEMKSFLMLVLNEMETNVSQATAAGKKPPDFEAAFNQARVAVLAKRATVIAPDVYKTGLKIFSSSRQSLSQVTTVHWNPYLAKLQAVTKFHKLKSKMAETVADSPLLRHSIQTYFENFRQDQTYTEAEAAHDEAIELSAPLLRSTFLTFSHDETQKASAMIRIFDASKGLPTYIEREFPQLRLPERDEHIPIYELGRLWVSHDIAGDSTPVLMARVAEYFENMNADGMIYLDCNRAAMVYYRRLGAMVAYTPEQIAKTVDDTPLWIMKIPVSQFVQKFRRADYEAVRLRD